MSSTSRTEYSSRIVSSVSPAASIPRMCSTAIRISRMMGLPPNTSARTVICSSSPGLVCAVERRCVPAGANPARQLSLQPEAVGAVQGGNELH